MLSKITKLRKNRQYDYKPRYYDQNGKVSPFKIEPKFDQFRSTLDTSRGLKRKLDRALDDAKRKGDASLKKRMLIIIGILIFIFLYIIDFDLTIFLS